MNSNPWHGLAVPTSSAQLTALRVDASSKWDLFWAVDSERRVLLVMRHKVKGAPKNRLPKLREIEVRSERNSDGQSALVWRLLASQAKDLFYRLCVDISEAIARCSTEAEAVEAAAGRTWRWHHLLKGGSTGLLSPARQMGLIGELLVLENHLLGQFSPQQAVNSWLGPLNAPQDFQIGQTGIESKAVSSEHAALVRISSEHQLSTDELDQLFLHVCHVDSASDVGSDALSLTEHVQRVRSKLSAADPSVLDRFDALLLATGYSHEHDYSAQKWIVSERSWFRVDDGFPRLTPSNIPSGTGSVSYFVDLRLSGGSLISLDTLRETLARSFQ